ncbi:MAG: pyruvate kinase [Candidatus Hodarchaeales archaeon]|jgi:pyruvate kinase
MISNTETRTKIVSTIGPASKDVKILKKLIKAGLDVCRLNFSHGTHDYHKETFEMIRDIDENIAILIDLSGPKIRIGDVEKPFDIKHGDSLIITSDDIIGNSKRVSVNHKTLPKEVKPGNTLFINDGIVGLTVKKVTKGTDIVTKCFAGGPVSSKKGINAPDVPLSLFFPTAKDLKDANFGIKLEPDFFAASFVRRPEDLKPIKEIIENDFKKVKIITKIEHRDALKNIEGIIQASDGIMVARGDLGIEIPTEDVPIVQKDLIKSCNEVGKPVIVATQMLESMTINKRPTRAEASDVFNAVEDGADAVMLSGETASGKWPIDSVEYMDKIARRAEEVVFSKGEHLADELYKKVKKSPTIPELLGYNAYYTGKRLKVAAILALTRTGGTARLIAKYRPDCPIIACTSVVQTARQLQATWGVIPMSIPVVTSTEHAILHSIKNAESLNYVKHDDQVLVIAGTLLGIPAKTNLMQVLNVADILALENTVKFQ